MCSRIQKLTVVLASASPRRTELLEQGNIKHVVMPSHSEEVITSQVPSQVVEELSAQKAEDVYQQYEKKNCRGFSGDRFGYGGCSRWKDSRKAKG